MDYLLLSSADATAGRADPHRSQGLQFILPLVFRSRLERTVKAKRTSQETPPPSKDASAWLGPIAQLGKMIAGVFTGSSAGLLAFLVGLTAEQLQDYMKSAKKRHDHHAALAFSMFRQLSAPSLDRLYFCSMAR